VPFRVTVSFTFTARAWASVIGMWKSWWGISLGYAGGGRREAQVPHG
jgi:hypothetical protein